MSRNAALFAVLLGCLTFPSAVWGQAGYCRIYRTMTMGGSVACYYCLKCPSCSDPQGALGTLTDTTGGCADCGAANCFVARAPMDPGPAAPNPPDDNQAPTPAPPAANPAPLRRAAAPAAANLGPVSLKVKKLTEVPSVLYDPDITSIVAKSIVSIDVTDDGVNNPVKLFVVLIKTQPKQSDGKPYQAKPTKIGFAHEIDTPLSGDTITTFEQVPEPGQFRFKYKGHDCVGIVEAP